MPLIYSRKLLGTSLIYIIIILSTGFKHNSVKHSPCLEKDTHNLSSSMRLSGVPGIGDQFSDFRSTVQSNTCHTPPVASSFGMSTHPEFPQPHDPSRATGHSNGSPSLKHGLETIREISEPFRNSYLKDPLRTNSKYSPSFKSEPEEILCFQGGAAPTPLSPPRRGSPQSLEPGGPPQTLQLRSDPWPQRWV